MRESLNSRNWKIIRTDKAKFITYHQTYCVIQEKFTKNGAKQPSLIAEVQTESINRISFHLLDRWIKV